MINRVAEANKITTGDNSSALAALDERSVRLDDLADLATAYPPGLGWHGRIVYSLAQAVMT